PLFEARQSALTPRYSVPSCSRLLQQLPVTPSHLGFLYSFQSDFFVIGFLILCTDTKGGFDTLFNFDCQVWIIFQETTGIFFPLTKLITIVGVPSTRFTDDAVFHAHI